MSDEHKKWTAEVVRTRTVIRDDAGELVCVLEGGAHLPPYADRVAALLAAANGLSEATARAEDAEQDSGLAYGFRVTGVCREVVSGRFASINAPLTATVEGDRLVIAIGIDNLAHASGMRMQEEAFERSEGESSVPEMTIVNNALWAKETAGTLLKEDEMGNSMLTRLLDKATENTLNSGSCAVVETECLSPCNGQEVKS